jgi:hypothetical protein
VTVLFSPEAELESARRQGSVLDVVRVYHHARRPLER